MRSKIFVVFGILVIASMIMTACQPVAAPETVTIIETVVVEKEGETVIETVMVEEPSIDYSAILPADGMVACNPLPEGYMAETETAAAASGEGGTEEEVFGVLTPSGDITGKVIKVGVFSDVTTANFWAANGPDNTVYNSYILPSRLQLFELSDKYFTLVPEVATDVPGALVEEDGMWVLEVPIRQDILWSDGTSLTAADVAYTSQIVKDFGLISGNWVQWFDYSFLDRIEAVDDYTVKIIYHTKPGLARHEWGTLQSPILNKAYWEAQIAATGAMDPIDALAADAATDAVLAAQQAAQDILFAVIPDGEPLAGAFIFGSREAGAFFENLVNETYFDTGTVVEQWASGAFRDSGGFELGDTTSDPNLTIATGPFAEAVIYSVYSDQNSAILALQAGEVDFVLNSLGLQRGLAESISGDPNLTVISNPTNGFRYLSFNNRRRPMNDCAFRQAVAALIDKEFVTRTILQNVAYPIYTYVPEGNAAWYYEDTPKIGYGLTREERTNLAITILETAGYTWEGDVKPQWDASNLQVVPGGRLIMPDGTPVPNLTIIAPSPGYDPLRSTFAIWIESWMNEIGIPVTAKLAGFNVLVPQIFTEQNFDMYILGWSLGLFPSFLSDFFSEAQSVLDGNNAGGYISPVFEELSVEMLTCETEEACLEVANQIQTLLATELPYVVLFDTGIIEAYRSASIEFPYLTQLSGLQYTWESGFQQTVNVK